MAIHGDEHGHRPRFVWQSLEDTQRLAALETPDEATRPSLGAVPPSSILHLVFAAPLSAALTLLAAPHIAPRQPARPFAYLLPFANGPPARS